jgi:hypothetical protein
VGRLRRLERLSASPVTLEVVSWTIGILVVLGATVVVTMLAHRFGWSWP